MDGRHADAERHEDDVEERDEERQRPRDQDDHEEPEAAPALVALLLHLDGGPAGGGARRDRLLRGLGGVVDVTVHRADAANCLRTATDGQVTGGQVTDGQVTGGQVDRTGDRRIATHLGSQ